MVQIAAIGNKIINYNNKIGLYPSCCCKEDEAEIICDCFDDVGTFCEFTSAGFATDETTIWIDISSAEAQCPGAQSNPITLWPIVTTTNPLQLFWGGLSSWGLSFSNPTGGIFSFELRCGPTTGWVLNGIVSNTGLGSLQTVFVINFESPKRDKNGRCSIHGIKGSGTIRWSYIEGNTVNGAFVPTVQCNGVENVIASISTVPCDGCFCP